MDELFTQKGRWNRRLPFTQPETELAARMLRGETVDWDALFAAFGRAGRQGFSAMDILMSRPFFDMVEAAYTACFDSLPFAQVYWTQRSMYLVVFALLLHDMPVADVYHAVSTGYAGLVGASAASRHGRALVLTEHGIYTREREEEIIKADWVQGPLKNMWIDFFYMLSLCAYDCASQVVTLFEKNRLVQMEIGCPADKTAVIHNGIDVGKFRETASAVSRRRQPVPVRVGAIVRVVPIKDLKTMMRAFAIVCDNKQDIEFIIMGPTDEDPEYYAECLAQKAALNLDRVIFTGSVDVGDWLMELDMLVLTSISEGQPLAILEGLAATLPFVTTSVGDCDALIGGIYDEFGPAGRIVPIMDHVAIADAILELAEQEDLRRRMGLSGFRRVATDYTFSAFIDGYRQIYARLGTPAKEEASGGHADGRHRF